MASGGGTGSADFIPHDEDSIERETILGYQLTNPYLINNMMQAYGNLGLNPAKAVVNNLYVRFLPSTNQLAALDSIMDAQGLELFDTPVDYQVLYEGDYYQDPSIPDSLPTWQYAVVPPSFQFPSGIPHQTLASIHIPADNYTAVETEAERLAAIQDSVNQTSLNGTVTPNTDFQCAPGYEWDPILGHCVPVTPPVCGSGYYWNGEQCVQEMPPPPPAADAAIPGGYILVHDTNLGTDVGVRKARVVARRWFKIDRVYTDNYGHFLCNKKFKHKVRINVKFKNDDAQIRNIRGASFWQMLFPVKVTSGIFSGDKSSVNFTFNQFSDYKAKGNIYWTAATVHNAVQEYRDFAATEHIGLPPQGLKIFISKNGLVGGGGSTPMFAKRVINNISTAFATSYLSPLVAAVIAVVKSQLDMVIGYKYTTGSSLDITQLLSDRIKETTYHELTHSAHYASLGNTWYTTFVTAEEYEIVANLSSGYSPYGDGTNSTFSPIIALGESWAYYMGHYLANKRYGSNSSTQNEQGIYYYNGYPLSGFSSHLNLLEDFSPYRLPDPFHWIPQGLFYDMMDARNEQKLTGGPVDDNVSDYYTNQKFFNAFSSSITTLGSYKTNLLNQNGNNQSPQVTSLFSQYGY